MQLNHNSHEFVLLPTHRNRDDFRVTLDSCQETPSFTSTAAFATQLRQAGSGQQNIFQTPEPSNPAAHATATVTARDRTTSQPRLPATALIRSGYSSDSSLDPSRSASPSYNPSLNPTPLSFDHLSLNGKPHPTTDTITPLSQQIDQHNQALTSLIDSLTSISNAQRGQSPDIDTRPKTADCSTARRFESGADQFDFSPELQRVYYQARDWQAQPSTLYSPYSIASEAINNNENAEEEDDDACPPPVAGYNTINAIPADPARPKTSGGNSQKSSSVYSKAKSIRGKLKSARSHANIKSAKPRRDLQTPESYQSSYYTRSSIGNASFVSAPSVQSDSARQPSIKMYFATSLGHDDEKHMPRDLSSPMRINKLVHESPVSTPENEKDETRRFSAFVAVSKVTMGSNMRRDTDNGTLASLSPTLRSDLSENLIPSRRSSLRGGPENRSSRNSRDLKSLNIDQDLIEANDGTVQRIKELQEAREKRHTEWRREAKKSDKASKRRSASNSQTSSPTKLRSASRNSWQLDPSLRSSSRNVDSPQLSATMTGNDISDMPAFIEADEPPITPPARDDRPNAFDLSKQRHSSIASSTSPSARPGTVKHRKNLSDSLRRVSLRPAVQDESKCVQDEVEAYLGSPRLTQKIRHPRTGRTIAFSEVGDPSGFVVLCCVGMGLTRYVSSFYDDIARSHKLRIITPDRPGVGETEALAPDRTAPLSWVDDVAVICSSLGIEKFSLLAHSAGAIYALATALKMPQYVRGRIHLLAPWIPPSVLAVAGKQGGNTKSVNLPTSHKLLSLLPVSFMKAANSRFLSTASASLEPKSAKERKNDAAALEYEINSHMFGQEASLSTADFSNSYMLRDGISENDFTMRASTRSPTPGSMTFSRSQTFSPSHSVAGSRSVSRQATQPTLTPEARERIYNTTLAHRTWHLATLNANPAQDLVICLERKKPIGFRYTDITRAVVIHHGANDSRVPLENIEWLSKTMKRCELHVLENEGHGLMASASVMANVLADIAKEWEEWSVITHEKEKDRKRQEVAEREAAQERERAFRRGYPRW